MLLGVPKISRIKACRHLPTTLLVCPVHLHPHNSHILRLDTPPHFCLARTTTLRSDPLSSSYFKMRSSSRPAHRHPSHSHRTPPHPPSRFAFLRAPSAMLSTFNIIRASVYCTFSLIDSCHSQSTSFTMIASVLLCSIICLAIAAHFLSVLSSSELSESYTHG